MHYYITEVFLAPSLAIHTVQPTSKGLVPAVFQRQFCTTPQDTMASTQVPQSQTPNKAVTGDPDAPLLKTKVLNPNRPRAVKPSKMERPQSTEEKSPKRRDRFKALFDRKKPETNANADEPRLVSGDGASDTNETRHERAEGRAYRQNTNGKLSEQGKYLEGTDQVQAEQSARSAFTKPSHGATKPGVAPRPACGVGYGDGEQSSEDEGPHPGTLRYPPLGHARKYR